MNIVELKYKLTKNLGNYESASLEATAQLEEGECPDSSFTSLKQYVVESLEGKTKTVEQKNNEVKKKAVEAEVVKEEEPKEEKKTTKKKAAKKTTKKATKKKEPKIENYDRANQSHKEEFARILNIHCEGWKDSAESKKLAKATSEDLVGTEMFKDGDLMESFVEAVKMAMAGDDL